MLQQNGELTRVRLNGIDAPEKAQPFGQRSRQSLTEMTAGKVVHIAGNNRDRYDRLLGTVWYDSKDINAVQVLTGMAWAYRYRGKAAIPAYAGLE
ncbi:thermonuclease family protein, partial [Leclercia adecarboxylata]|uniref:thermonuclease family protein n=1 Tax=Leclercia adecarboxylata TaxID=83655 RepID=UPI0029499912